MICKIKDVLKKFYMCRVIKKSGAFDKEYYLRNNLDVARSCINPVKHYIYHGWLVGKYPNQHFDTKWYLETYPDVRISGMNPFYHYIKHGAKECRDPSRDFSTLDYIAMHPDILRKQENPLKHTMMNKFIVEDIGAPLSIPFDLFGTKSDLFRDAFKDKHVSIVVPVYNGYIHLEKLLKTIYANSGLNFGIIAIDDASQDRRVLELLKSYKNEYENFKFFQNPKNLGFVRTVNKGLKIADKDDCIIINTDVEVPQDWLFKLFYPLWTLGNVASVTPMSNSATIMSFPNFGHNELPEDLTLQDINDEFSKLNPGKNIYIETPTGHGFCMAVSRKAIKEIGFFDEVFGKGYGEENDWCMRALDKGFVNLIATNIFLYHKHTASFCSKKRDKCTKRNSRILKSRYPEYEALVRHTMLIPSYRNIREILYLMIIAKQAKRTVLRFENNLSGGSYYACEDYIVDRKDKELVLIIRPRKKYFALYCYYKDYHRCFELKTENEISKLFSLIKINNVVINQVVGYISLAGIFQEIANIKKISDAIVELNVRDFFCVCPNFNLMYMGKEFCYVKNQEDCGRCYNQNNNFFGAKDILPSIKEWRNLWSELLSSVDQINVFSSFTKSILAKCYPSHEGKIKISTIPVTYLRKVRVKIRSDIINIGVLGNINYVKGSGILKDMLSLTKRNKNINLFLFGKTNDGFLLNNVIYKGQYKREDLPYLMEQNEISLIFIPSICGETFCRTVQEAIEMDMPVAVFNIGAPVERVRKYSRGLVIEKMNAEFALLKIIDFVKKMSENNAYERCATG